MLTLSKLRSLYKDPSMGLVGKQQFITNLLENDFKFKESDVDQLFQSEASISLNKPVVRNFERRPVIVTHPYQVFGADLTFLPQFAKENDGFTTMLFVIDFFSKLLFVELVKDKKSATITEAFKKIFKKTKLPENVNVDAGGEFKGETFKYLTSEGINVYIARNETKVPIVERVQRTIKQRIGKLLDGTGSYRYVDILPEIVKSYNNTKHSTTKFKPVDAVKPENEKAVRDNIFKFIERTHKVKHCKPSFEVGDQVRISIRKGTFEKEMTHKWSREVFRIKEVLYTLPCTYVIEDLKDETIEGSFYEPELQKVDIDEDTEAIDILKRRTIRGQKQVQVKYQSGKTAWILEDGILTI